MPNDIMLIAALLVPIVVLVLFRINAAMVFFSLCLGYVLVQFVANDADSLISFVAPDAESVSASTLKLAMLFLPPALTMFFMSFSVHGHGRMLLNILPAAAVSTLGLLLAVPLFTPGLRHAIQGQNIWPEFHDAQAMIIGAGALICMVFLLAQSRYLQALEHRRKRH